mmetsp:Transcript_22552/g.67685  ORF Transcript_22552/g.67685 Transcript_22552/m.67685 type:complete len:342 (+) Transcript_22552:541-1566(+)
MARMKSSLVIGCFFLAPSSAAASGALSSAFFSSSLSAPSPSLAAPSLPSTFGAFSFSSSLADLAAVPFASIANWGGGKMAINLSTSISQSNFLRNAWTSSKSTTPVGEMTSYRFSGLPPCASMQTRNLAATSIRNCSFSAKALCNASCRPFMTTPSTCLSRTSIMSLLAFSATKSSFRSSPNSCRSRTSLANACIFSASRCRAERGMPHSSSRALEPIRSSATFRLPASLLNFCAATSASLTCGMMDSRVSSIWAQGSLSSACLRTMRSFRFWASSASRRSFSMRCLRFARPRASSRAMPTAVFNCWKSSNLTPSLPGFTNCLRIRSKFVSGISKPNSSLA